ncbi:HvfC/BufC N-terminal domain-containing protein [Paracoccus aerodenitrificans]|uniref:HvfC/BufC N-terminal domain-containing protein n=1 Tax=Paracoccus aerodenitrificans TaxID=3017781 RepID=UPI0022F0B75D|nr:DNA-binding domain-containing protein [Paracoccus aerodenitrificans]WBU64937.1 DNA-binding domain-containing protein [Paracoccus aerodenitrificans]
MTYFAAALLSPEANAPEGLELPQGGDPARRFSVYRNNVNVALCTALADNFPVVTSLVGREFMMALARIFIATYPPQTPVLAEWGDAFPAWLAGFAPVSRLEYLPDMARLEHLCRLSVNASDAAPVAPKDIAAMTPEALSEWQPRLHPSTQSMATAWPLLKIRRHALGLRDGEQTETGEILITRPALSLVLRPAPTGTIAALKRLAKGIPLGAALDDLEHQAAILTTFLRYGTFAEEGKQ